MSWLIIDMLDFPNLKKLPFLFFLLCSTNLLADTLTLQDTLAAAIEKQKTANLELVSPVNVDQPANTWLAGTPSVSLLYLHNLQSVGSKEAEISVNLPIKSRIQREIDQQLQHSAPIIQQHARQQQALFLSGLIRTVIWDIKLQQVYIKQQEQKLSTLNSLLSHFTTLSNAGNSPDYVALLVQQEALQSRLALMTHQSESEKLKTEYSQLTGLDILPDNMIEASSNLNNVEVSSQHPDLLALDAAWQVFVSQFTASSSESQPWNLSITAKQVDAQGIKDNQIGIGIELPFSYGNQYTQTQYAEFNKSKTQYFLEREKLQQNIVQSINSAKAALSLVKERQTLLDQALSITQQLSPTLDNLMLSNNTDKEWILRRILEIIDTQAQYAVNQVNIHKHAATLNQALGKTL